MVADPASRDAIHYLQQLDSPAHMAELFQMATRGFCSNAREILFGVSQERLELVHAVAVASGDPRASELESLARKGLADINAGTDDLRSSPPTLLAPLGWMGMRGVRERMSSCMNRRGPRGR